MKKLGPLHQLKDPELIQRIDFGNDYHLPQIVKTIEMVEEEKCVCQRFLKKHKFNLSKQPRSRRGAKKSPMARRTRNMIDTDDKYSKTHMNFMSPQHNRLTAGQIYAQKNVVVLNGMNQTTKRNKPKPHKNVIGDYISMRAEDVKRQKESASSNNEQNVEPNYSDEKVADNFMNYNKQKVQENNTEKDKNKQAEKQPEKPQEKQQQTKKPSFKSKPDFSSKPKKSPRNKDSSGM